MSLTGIIIQNNATLHTTRHITNLTNTLSRVSNKQNCPIYSDLYCAAVVRHANREN